MAQRTWYLLDEETSFLPPEERLRLAKIAEVSPLDAFAKLLLYLNEKEGAWVEELKELNKVPWTKTLVGLVNQAIRSTLTDSNYWTPYFIMEKIKDTVNIVLSFQGKRVDRSEVDESDHGGDTDAPEELIDWSELTGQGLVRLERVKSPLGGSVLFQIFLNLVRVHCAKAGVDLPSNLEKRYSAWYSGGVFTRARFKELIGLSPTQGGSGATTTVQRARTGNTYSFNGGYTGTSNSFGYNNVIYYRDSGGNIDFTGNPKDLVKAYNKSEGAAIKATSIDWKHPQKGSSIVQMRNDLKDKEKGVMPSGKKVTLKSASRAQHFAIADMLYPNNRGGTWTWHHLTSKYKMVLVDMRVHQKHGHNGGVHLWK